MPALTRLLRAVSKTSLGLLCFAGLLNPSPAIEPDPQPLEKKISPHASVDDIARQINQQPQWRILAAEPTVEDEKLLYRFKLLNKQRGRVEVITVDPDQPEPIKQLD